MRLILSSAVPFQVRRASYPVLFLFRCAVRLILFSHVFEVRHAPYPLSLFCAVRLAVRGASCGAQCVLQCEVDLMAC